MTEKQVNKILGYYKQSMENVLPKNEKSIRTLWLSLKEIFDGLMFIDKTKMPKQALSRRGKTDLNFDNILDICKTSIQLTKQNDLENLSRALGYMDAKLFQIILNAQNGRKVITRIMNKVNDELP